MFLLTNLRNLKNKPLLSLFCFVFLSLFIGNALSQTEPINISDIFPELIFKDNLTEEDSVYLGISKKKFPSFKEIKGHLIIVEITSTYCISCRNNIPVLNDVFYIIQNDTDLKGKVKIISIAAGNNRKEVNNFKKEYKIIYPIFTDPDFAAHKALGSPRAPYTIFVIKDAQGGDVVVGIHQGVFNSVESIINEINILLARKNRG
ncbi:MAG: TlpA disulfide reductase family protein [Nitrospirota bacterium]